MKRGAEKFADLDRIVVAVGAAPHGLLLPRFSERPISSAVGGETHRAYHWL